MQKTESVDYLEPFSIVELSSLKGCLYGSSQPSLVCLIKIGPCGALDWGAADVALPQLIALYGDPPTPIFDTKNVLGMIQRLVYWTACLQVSALYPVFDQGRLLSSAEGRALITLPTIDETIATTALKTILAIINISVSKFETSQSLETVRASVAAFREKGRLEGLNQPNMIPFLMAARARGIPAFRLVGDIFQIGYGVRSRWLQSSLTDATSQLGHKLASNKSLASHLMRAAGVPTPAHYVVRDEDAAVRCAKVLGYPVVIKPLNSENGRGVSAGLEQDNPVRKAYKLARSFADLVLVEKFVPGRDYRMVVHDGQLIWAMERIHGGVIGDGRSTIKELIDQLNKDPQRSSGATGGLRILEIDEEVRDRLTTANLSLMSIPLAGVEVRLRGAANQSRGGTSIGVFDAVHVDNRRLAERAAAALGLDLAGVDLIVPDIRRSWKETGGGVCEINARPALGFPSSSHLYGEILERMLGGDGRIPNALLIGPTGRQACSLISRLLAPSGVRVGIASTQTVRIGDEVVFSTPSEAYDAARLLAGDRTVEAALVAIDDVQPLKTGLPFDRFSVVALASSDIKEAANGVEAFQRLAAAFLPSTLKTVVINANDSVCMSFWKRIGGAKICLFSDVAGPPHLLEHCAHGQMAVWMSQSEGEACVTIVNGPQGSFTFKLSKAYEEKPCLANESAEVALSVAVGLLLGCSEDRLKQVLGG